MPITLQIDPPVSNISEVPGDRGRCGHHWTRQGRPPAATLAAFEIAVAGGGATLSGTQNVGVHPQAHRTSGLAPLEAGILENLVETFLLGAVLHVLRSRNHHSANPGCDFWSFSDPTAPPPVFHPRA